jgi:hypothetical protein
MPTSTTREPSRLAARGHQQVVGGAGVDQRHAGDIDDHNLGLLRGDFLEQPLGDLAGAPAVDCAHQRQH